MFGVFKNTKTVNTVVHEQSKAYTLLVAETVEDVFYENGKNSKHPNFYVPFIKSIFISNQFRGFGLDFCHDNQFSAFNFFSTYLYNLFTSIEKDVKSSSLPLFKLFNNYRI